MRFVLCLLLFTALLIGIFFSMYLVSMYALTIKFWYAFSALFIANLIISQVLPFLFTMTVYGLSKINKLTKGTQIIMAYTDMLLGISTIVIVFINGKFNSIGLFVIVILASSLIAQIIVCMADAIKKVA
jgi:hypothetical protein